jgi:cytochrome c-type biogenesis protein
MDALALAPGAFLAGVLMFLAPCTLPIIPGYLIFISGTPVAGEEVSAGARRRRVLWSALAFVLGFSVVFISLGVFAAAIGGVLGHSRDYIARGAGLVIILFGLMMLRVIKLPVVGGEWHAKIPKFLTVGRWESSLFIGALFALGWSPCIGPILGTVLLLATTAATAGQGAFLLAVFSLGLGVPFFLTALLIDTAGALFTKWGRAIEILSSVGGGLLILLGVLMLFGALGSVTAWTYGLFEQLGYERLYQYL